MEGSASVSLFTGLRWLLPRYPGHQQHKIVGLHRCAPLQGVRGRYGAYREQLRNPRSSVPFLCAIDDENCYLCSGINISRRLTTFTQVTHLSHLLRRIFIVMFGVRHARVAEGQAKRMQMNASL